MKSHIFTRNILFIVVCFFSLSIPYALNRKARIANDQNFISVGTLLCSPSGLFEAKMERKQEDGVRLYTITVTEVSHPENTAMMDISLRERDQNYVIWSDKSDVLWVYSGDIGLYLFEYNGRTWVKKVHTDDRDQEMPEALQNNLSHYLQIVKEHSKGSQ